MVKIDAHNLPAEIDGKTLVSLMTEFIKAAEDEIEQLKIQNKELEEQINALKGVK